MKKFDWEEFRAYIILTIVVLIMIGIMFLVEYMEEEYELKNYLWIFNILVLVITPVYYFIHNTQEKRKTKKIEDNTIIKDIDFKYYRDIITEYSPATLSFILDGIEFKKDISASIIYLINKGYLELVDDTKIQRTNKECNELSKDLQFICNNINNMLYTAKIQLKKDEQYQKNEIKTNYANSLRQQWWELIEKEAIEKELVIQRKTWRITSWLSILCMLEAIYSMYIGEWGLICFSVVLVFLLMFIKTWVYDENKWVKTQKGYEIYTKVVGLRNYIKDYSLLSNSELEQIKIWEDYLIYAIILNNTSRLNKKALDFYNEICEKI